ncbi:TonB-dependent receptor [Xanthomonadaceae bacterium JHOS43]|nr:TonB-dependent receptor [Xanthomonadaceae bacterium JHOS43]
MSHRFHPLSVAVSLSLCCAVTATAAHGSADALSDTALDAADPARLSTIVVSALGVGEDETQVAAPFSLVEGEAILQKGEGTLGDALNGLPGVHSDTFGGGASRPVIRGQGAPRVKVLSDGASLLDASDISPDHAVSADPLLLQRVEVLRGPATLLYGSGAVGGVVNLLDNRIPTELPEDGFDGSIALRGNTVANERAVAATLTSAISDRLATHAEFSTRDADDYRVPGWSERRVEGSFSESTNAAVGLSWITDTGHIGLAYSRRDDDYGLPGHDHEYGDCHPHAASLHCGGHDHDHGHDHTDEHDRDHADAPTIDLESRRFDLRGEFNDPFIGIRRIRFRASHTDYFHHEIEHGRIATTFRNTGHEERIEVQHEPLRNWTGIFGIQHSDTRFSAEGVEAFLPTVDTRSTGLFLIEHLDFSDRWHFEVGARHEWIKHDPRNDPRARPGVDGSATSFSGAAIWSFAPDTSLSLALTRSERLPHAQELYARGIHLATNTWECGLLPNAFTCGGAGNDAALETETSRNAELTLRRTTGPLTYSVGAFINHVDDYIHARTLDQDGDFRLIKYSQRDAEFTGFEMEVGYRFSEQFSGTLFADRVRAELEDDGAPLPRIPASRIGGRLNGEWRAFSGEIEYYAIAAQERLAEFETRTPAHNMLNLSLRYAFGSEGRTSLFLRGSNLLDEQIWNHASFLANVVPLPGRNISMGLTHRF